MKESLTRPTEGQFVEVSEHYGNIWSDTFRWSDGSLYIFSDHDGEWKIREDIGSNDKITYLTLGPEKPQLGIMPEKEHKVILI